MSESKVSRSNVQVRVSEKLHADWKKVCQEQSINGSALIRKWMQEYVEEQKEGE